MNAKWPAPATVLARAPGACPTTCAPWQALVDSGGPSPRRLSVGLDRDRLAMLLAVLLAIQSSLRGRPLPRGFIAFGEIGLAGEVRPAPRGQERLREAAKLGFGIAVVPRPTRRRRRCSRAWRSTPSTAWSGRWTWCGACRGHLLRQ